MSSSLSSAARSLTARTLHLKVHPTPRTFSERREVLRVIERFGEVTVFKSLKVYAPLFTYDPHRPVHNAFLAVYSSPLSAKDLQNVSPLRYRLVTESSSPNTADAASDGTSDSTIFELMASETNYDHNAFLTSAQMNPLHGPYIPASPKNSYIAASLSKLIPDSNWSEGLGDWETEKSRWRNDDILAPEEETLHGPDGTPISDAWLKARRANAHALRQTPRIMNGLQPLWKERVEMGDMPTRENRAREDKEREHSLSEAKEKVR